MAGSGRKNGDSTLVLALAAGTTVKEAAEQVGVGERTVYRRLEDAEFQRRVAAARSEMLSRGVGMLADATTEAVSTMRKLLAAKSESVQLAAARAILELASRLRESVELEQRITELEQQANGQVASLAIGQTRAAFGGSNGSKRVS